MITIASLLAGLLCLVIYLVCRGDDKAFGQFMGVFLAIAFVGALVIFGGGFILLFALPLLLMIGAPLIFLAAAASIIARFLNALGSERPADCTTIRKREE
jgi:hypothetical protein